MITVFILLTGEWVDAMHPLSAIEGLTLNAVNGERPNLPLCTKGAAASMIQQAQEVRKAAMAANSHKMICN